MAVTTLTRSVLYRWQGSRPELISRVGSHSFGRQHYEWDLRLDILYQMAKVGVWDREKVQLENKNKKKRTENCSFE